MNSSEYLPPPSVGRWRAYERSALQIRGFVGIGIHARLDPRMLADLIGLRVIGLDELAGVSREAREILMNGGAWSGGATTRLPDGSHIIILNSAQSAGRQAATLMEEICHILFGHRPTLIASWMESGRDYDHIKEEEAYGVGAAALLPYFALKTALSAGQSLKTIAKRFGVSVPLVGYRSKGLKL
ncbi:MAG: ImmA/IrrE family metallo-endopeptidase [Blastocatellia bacterium]